MSLNFGIGSHQQFIPLDSDSLAYINGGSRSGGGGESPDIATPDTAGIVKPDDISIGITSDGTISVKQYAMLLTYEELPDPDVGQGGSEDLDFNFD